MQPFQKVVLIAAACAAIAGATAPPDPEFAPLGGSYGQTVRILVSALPPDPCSVAVGFRTGETTPPDPDRTFNLAPGQTAVHELSLNRLAGRFGVRVEVRPRVVILSGRCSASAEVFEVFSGRTTASMRLFLGAVTPPDPGTNLSPPDPNFAALGAVPGQIVRLGVGRGEGFNTYAPPCRGTLAFKDLQGNIVGPTRTFDLMPGQMTFLDLDPSKVGAFAAAASRVTVRPQLIPPPDPEIVNPLGSSLGGCQASAQVFESSIGWSTEAVSGAGGVAPPDPDFAPLGGSYGQTMRIHVSAYPPDPCIVTVGFRTGETSPPEPERSFNLAPGQTAFSDLNLNRLAGRFGVRVEVTPRVMVKSGKCSASAEVLEVFSGRTTAHMNLGAVSPPDPESNLQPPPDPEFAALNAVSGQVVRVGVGRGEGFNTIPPPCRGTLAFADMQGNIVGPTRAVDLMPGQRAFLDLPFPTPWINLRPVLLAPPAADTVNPIGGNIHGCLASVQIYESSTGWSTEAVSGR
jgi:hypothetical protein